MKKTIVLLFIFILLIVGVYFFRYKGSSSSIVSNKQVEISAAPAHEIGSPKKLIIPGINVNANVEYVGLDSRRYMDVPKKAENVGWYDLGPRPGEIGSSVFAGHLDDESGAPAVFWNLKKLSPGQ